MGLKRNVDFFGFFRPLGASDHRNLLDKSPGGPRRLHSWLNFLHGRLIRSYSLSRRSSRDIPLRLLVITARGNRFYITRKKESKNSEIIELAENTYDAIRSKNSTPSSSTGASLAAVLCTEVLEEVNSLTRFLFLSAPVSSESAGGGDVVELVSSSDSLASFLS
jgi:hypothetical protein